MYVEDIRMRQMESESSSFRSPRASIQEMVAVYAYKKLDCRFPRASRSRLEVHQSLADTGEDAGC